MNFLLAAVNAKYIHSNPAVYSLRAYAGKEYENYISIAEYTINHRTEYILSDIYKRNPDAVGFSCYIWNITLVLSIIKELHKLKPALEIWLGGPEASFDAESILKDYPMITGVMIGEGEKTFSALMKYYLEKKTGAGCKSGPHYIQGIVYRFGSTIIKTGERELTDMKSLPFLYEDLESFQNRIIYYESSRGCPYRCSYCLSAIDKKVRYKEIETIKKELRFFLDRKVPQVKFVDRTFNCSHAHTMAVWQFIQENDNGITNFHFEIAADILTEEELRLLSLMRPGLVQLEIGVQSANRETLREINRNTDLDRLKKAVARIHENQNIHMHLDLIAGLPFEDYKSFAKSFNTVYEMDPHQLQLGFLKVLKGSPLHEKAGSYGIIYTDMPPYEVLYSKWLPYDRLCKLKQIEEMVELYYNSSQFRYTLAVLEKAFEGPFSMYEKLAEYYEEKGLFINSPSRVYRYEVLLDFACLWDPEQEALYKELLTYDIYLREDMKSRPAFATDLTAFREKIKALQKDPALKRMHVDIFSYPVWEEMAERRRNKLEKERAILFDYQKRNPLTKEAAVEIHVL